MLQIPAVPPSFYGVSLPDYSRPANRFSTKARAFFASARIRGRSPGAKHWLVKVRAGLTGAIELVDDNPVSVWKAELFY